MKKWPVEIVAGSIDGKMIGDPKHEFELASVTKLLTSRAVLVAVEEGAFELDTVVNLGEGCKTVLAEGAGGGERSESTSPGHATVAHLLAHASGVGFASRNPEKAPETRRIYSSAGYEILADLVAETTGIPFARYLDEAVCQPLGMTHTRLYGSAGHGATSTAEDMDLFAQEMMNPQLVADPHYEVWFPLLDGVVPGYGMFKPCPWALGPEVKREKGLHREHWMGTVLPENTVGHFGQAGTFLWAIPGEHYCVMLGNRNFGDWAKPLWSEWNDELARELL